MFYLYTPRPKSSFDCPAFNQLPVIHPACPCVKTIRKSLTTNSWKPCPRAIGTI